MKAGSHSLETAREDVTCDQGAGEFAVFCHVGGDGKGRESLEKLLELVRKKDLDQLRESYRYLLSQVDSPTEELERARDIIAKMVG